MQPFFKSLIDQDPAPVVICDLEHTICYMNPASIARYHKDLTGKSLIACHKTKSAQLIDRVVAWFASNPAHNSVHTFYNEKENKDVYMVALRSNDGTLIGYYEKHEFRNRDMTPFYFMDL